MITESVGTRAPAAGGGLGLSVSAVLAAALIWSSSFAVTKVALAEIPPMTIGAMRFVLGGVVVIAGVTLGSYRKPKDG